MLFLALLSQGGGGGGAYRMVASVILWSPTFSKDLFSKTGQISFKFHMQPPGKKVIFRPSHMTKMATIPIFGKNVKNLLRNF